MPIAHDVRGSGPALVLLHGITEDRRSWDPLTNELAHDHTVLRVDLRGHGQSAPATSYELADYAADVAELVDEPPLLVGHSLGGAVATAYAAAHEARGVLNVDQSLDLAGLQQQVKAAGPALRGDSFAAAMAALFDSMRGTTPDDEWERLTALRRPVQPVVLGTWAMMLEQDEAGVAALVAELTAAVHVPYLALFGIDPGAGHEAWLQQRIPQARMEVWAGLGHYPHLVEPGRFLDLVREFEQTLESP